MSLRAALVVTLWSAWLVSPQGYAAPPANAVMLGVPYQWREHGRDAVSDTTPHEVLLAADIIRPWAVGHFRSPDEMKPHEEVMATDLAWLSERGKGYLPVMFPGFSGQNLKRAEGEDSELNAISRLSGRFLWSQAAAAKRAGAQIGYVAMFDEMIEGIAIFKCTNAPPRGESAFMDFEGLPSDYYLWLTGQVGRLMAGELEPQSMPTLPNPAKGD